MALKGSEPSQHVAETILDSSSLNSPNCAGRIRIDPMVLEELRQFFVGSSELNRFSSQIQSKSSEDIVEMDHTITPNPVSSEGSDRSKGKAIVLEPKNKKATSDSSKEPFSRQTLSILSSPDFITDGSAAIMKDCFGNKGSFTSAPSFSEAGTSKPFTKRAYVRKKPYKSRSNLKGTSLSLSVIPSIIDKGLEEGINLKRKNLESETPAGSVKIAKLSKNEMVPFEGLSDH